jgi:hypothetical protein
MNQELFNSPARAGNTKNNDLPSAKQGAHFKVGDANHLNAVEVVTCYPDWAERNERMFEEIKGLFRKDFQEKDRFKKPDYVT